VLAFCVSVKHCHGGADAQHDSRTKPNSLPLYVVSAEHCEAWTAGKKAEMEQNEVKILSAADCPAEAGRDSDSDWVKCLVVLFTASSH